MQIDHGKEKDHDVHAKSKRIQHGNHTIAFRVWNAHMHNKMPLILVQGLSGVKEDWFGIDKELARDRPVLIFDNRGVGESGHGDPGFSLQEMAEDVIFLMDYLGWKMTNIMGVSMGGFVAIKAISLQPLRFYKVVIGCSTPGGPDSEVSEKFINLFLQPYQSERDRVRDIYAINVSTRWRSQHQKEFDKLVEHSFAFKRPKKGIMYQLKATKALNLHEDLPRVKQQVLLIHGTDDQVLPFKNSALFTKSMYSCRLVRLADVGHMFWLEAKKETVAAIRSFLNTPSSAL